MVTIVRYSYTSEPFTVIESTGKLYVGDGMSVSSGDKNQRRGGRTKAVLPVRVKGKNSAGKPFDELVHTLDVTPDGARLGSVRSELNLLDEVTVFYRQRKLQFRVVWIKKMSGTSEFQVGLKATGQDKEAWGLDFPGYKRQAASDSAAAHASGIA